jgi:DNA-binding response OmpR family regulator
MSRPVVLLVSADAEARGGYAELLRSHGFDAREAGTAAHAIAIAREIRIDLVILEVDLPDRSGLDLAADIREAALVGDVPILAFIGEWEARQPGRSEELRVVPALMKPSAPGPLLAEVYRALKTNQPER